MGSDTIHQTRLLKATSNLALNSAREGAATTSLGNMCQCLTTLTVKNFFLSISSKATLFQFKAITPCPVPTGPCKKSLSSFLAGPIRYWKAALRSLWSSLFSGLKSPNSQPFLVGRCSSPRIIFVASSGATPTGPRPSCAESPRARHRTPGGVS